MRDTGVGIPADLLPKIFDRFMQVSDTRDRSQGGLGIGLALVRHIVNLHGGSVEAFSEGPGKGCEFRIRLPLLARSRRLRSAVDGAPHSEAALRRFDQPHEANAGRSPSIFVHRVKWDRDVRFCECYRSANEGALDFAHRGDHIVAVEIAPRILAIFTGAARGV